MALTHEILMSIQPWALATYPEAGEAYRKLADWVGVSSENILLTPGSDGAIRLVFEAFIEHGDAVMHTLPTFAMYPVYCQMFGARQYPLEYERKADAPVLDPLAIVSGIRKHRPKVLCLPNPDSPTGTVLSPDALREILSECEAVGALLLLDEAYHPFYPWSGVPWTEHSRNLVVARTFAKAWGAAGLRVGYAVAHREVIAVLHKMRPMYEVNALAVEFISKVLDSPSAMWEAVARINDGKRLFVEEMTALRFQVLPTTGNFVHVAFGEQGPAIHASLSNKVFYRESFSHPCLEGYSRFTAAPRPIMLQVVDVIKEALVRS